MVNPNPVGLAGERYARLHLQQLGYQIIAANFTTRMGEIDIIAKQGNKLVFVEVKSRLNTIKGLPIEAVTPRKIRHLSMAIKSFLKQYKYGGCKLSACAIGVMLSPSLQLLSIKLYTDIPISLF